MATIRYDNQSATRNQPITAELERVLIAAAEAAGIDEVVIFSGGQDAEGGHRVADSSTRHDHGNSADIRLYKDGRRLISTNKSDEGVLKSFAQSAVANGATGIGAGEGYMNGNMHVGFQGQESFEGAWGDGGASANAPGWLRQAFDAGSNGLGGGLGSAEQRQSAGQVAMANQISGLGQGRGSGDAAGGSYTIQPGDNLTQIARRHNTTVNELARLNGISNLNQIAAGATLQLPNGGGPTPANNGQQQSGSHTVQRGDTLWDIAQRQLGDGNRWQEIAQANGITDPQGLQPGQQLTIPGAGGPSGRNRLQEAGQGLREGIQRFRRAMDNGSPVGEALRAATGDAMFADERGWNQATGSVLNNAPTPRGAIPDNTPIPRPRTPLIPMGPTSDRTMLRPGDRPRRTENASDILAELGGAPTPRGPSAVGPTGNAGSPYAEQGQVAPGSRVDFTNGDPMQALINPPNGQRAAAVGPQPVPEGPLTGVPGLYGVPGDARPSLINRNPQFQDAAGVLGALGGGPPPIPRQRPRQPIGPGPSTSMNTEQLPTGPGERPSMFSRAQSPFSGDVMGALSASPYGGLPTGLPPSGGNFQSVYPNGGVMDIYGQPMQQPPQSQPTGQPLLTSPVGYPGAPTPVSIAQVRPQLTEQGQMLDPRQESYGGFMDALQQAGRGPQGGPPDQSNNADVGAVFNATRPTAAGTQNDNYTGPNYTGPNYGEAMAGNTQVQAQTDFRANLAGGMTPVEAVRAATEAATQRGRDLNYGQPAIQPPSMVPQQSPTLTPAQQQQKLQQMYGF